jgi:hypothetical protein
MHTPSPIIEEDMKFLKVLPVKQFSGKKTLETDHVAIFGPLLQLHNYTKMVN